MVDDQDRCGIGVSGWMSLLVLSYPGSPVHTQGLLAVQLFIAVKSLLGPEYNSNLLNSCLIYV